jgi:hypothetical protein
MHVCAMGCQVDDICSPVVQRCVMEARSEKLTSSRRAKVHSKGMYIYVPNRKTCPTRGEVLTITCTLYFRLSTKQKWTVTSDNACSCLVLPLALRKGGFRLPASPEEPTRLIRSSVSDCHYLWGDKYDHLLGTDIDWSMHHKFLHTLVGHVMFRSTRRGQCSILIGSITYPSGVRDKAGGTRSREAMRGNVPNTLVRVSVPFAANVGTAQGFSVLARGRQRRLSWWGV